MFYTYKSLGIKILVVLTTLVAAFNASIQSAGTALAQTSDPVFVGAGDIADCTRTEDESTAQLLDSIAGTVFSLGDNVYEDGTPTEFNDCYVPTWGRHKNRTRPSPGNHEYHVAGAPGYYTYFGSAASPLDNNCTNNCKGYYSYNLGAWHIIALNSQIAHGVGSAQEQWLRADLAAHQSVCTLAYWHFPLFSSGFHGNITGVQTFWQALYDYRADVVLSGHDHMYERFAPQNPNGQADPTLGIREFVVGTGGTNLNQTISTIQPNSQVRNSITHGVLKLTLHPTSYDWEFIPIAGQTFTDSGSSNCVGAGLSPTATPTPIATSTPTNTPTNTPPLPSGYSHTNVYVGGALQGEYDILSKSSVRLSYAGLNSGPVRVVSMNGIPIVASGRVAYTPNGGTTWTSYSELMGLPANQLTSSYTFPWYNNVDINSQLRFGNVGTANTTVTVTIGGMFKGNYNLAPNASTRISYPGLDKGPVKVTSSGNVPIIASMRVAYFDGSAWTGFSEMMGLPSTKLTNSYVFPWYNNLDLNSQLRFGNVGSVTTTVTVTVGGVFKGNYTLAPNTSQRISYPGLDKGPVKVTSSGNVPIIASMRVAYFNGTAWSDFSEMMGMPSSSLSSHYSFPVYDNVLHNSQLRFGNVGTAPTTVTVTVNGVVKGTYNLAPNASQRVSYDGLDSGPVVIQSTGGVPIIASERVAYFDGSAWTSFAEMMGLPQSQLTTTYVFPWYNNVDINSQLRFGVP